MYIEKNREDFENYLEFIKKYDYYFNPLEVLNMGENSISQLLAWLLDTNWVFSQKGKDIPENQIHIIFTYEILKLIREKEQEPRILQSYDDERLKELAKGIHSLQDVKNIDILLWNEDEKFVCIIENKKRAKLSTSRVSNNSYERQLQIEKYTNDITQLKLKTEKGKKINFEKYNQKFVYLCADKKDIEKTIEERLSDTGAIPDYIIDNLVFNNQKYDKFKDKKIEHILTELNYTILEHNEIVLILYNILQNLSKDSFENGILKPITQDEMFNLTKIIITLYKNRTKKFAKKIVKIFKNRIIKKYNERCKNDNSRDKYFRYEIDIKGKLKKNIRINGNSKMYFWDKFDNDHEITYKERLAILCRYIEYWELHRGIGSLSDNIEEYTKIVNGKYIWDICKEISSKDSNYWEQIKNRQTSSNSLKELIEHIDHNN